MFMPIQYAMEVQFNQYSGNNRPAEGSLLWYWPKNCTRTYNNFCGFAIIRHGNRVNRLYMRFVYLLHVEYLRIVSVFHPGVQQREQYGHRLYISSLRPHAVIHAGYSCAFLDIRWSVCVSVCLPVIGVGTLTVAFDLHAWLLCTVMLGLSGTVSSLSR